MDNAAQCPPPEAIEPMTWLLAGGLLVFTILLILVGKWSPNDGQTFQFLSTVAAGFAGALWRHITPDVRQKPDAPPNGVGK